MSDRLRALRQQATRVLRGARRRADELARRLAPRVDRLRRSTRRRLDASSLLVAPRTTPLGSYGTHEIGATKVRLPDRLDGRVGRAWARGRFDDQAVLGRIGEFGVGGTYVDVGAGTGNDALYFARVCGSDRVVALEPDAERVGRARSLITLNGASRKVEIHEAAASDTAGPVEGTGATAFPLDDLELDHVTILRIAASASGASVLRGSTETIRRCRPRIFIDLSDDDVQQTAELLATMGYRKIQRVTPSTYEFAPPPDLATNAPVRGSSRRTARYSPAQWPVIRDVVPGDVAEQVTADRYVTMVAEELAPGSTVVDLGCGAGKSRRRFRLANPDLHWIGVDIPSSPEAATATQPVPSLVHFDGVALPFADASVECVYSKQVMEHVRHPERLLAEVRRVLRAGGYFVGTTSNLEPYHSFSYWNFTPFGFRTIVEDAGLELTELRPGIDGPTLIERQLRNRPPELSRFFGETSPVNDEIIRRGTATGLSAAEINSWMLHFCGHFGFVVRRR